MGLYFNFSFILLFNVYLSKPNVSCIFNVCIKVHPQYYSHVLFIYFDELVKVYD